MNFGAGCIVGIILMGLLNIYVKAEVKPAYENCECVVPAYGGMKPHLSCVLEED